MIYDVLDVARYIINYSNEKGYEISNLKLQKILYFVQAYFLYLDKEKPCFYEAIEAWDFGPVVPEVYREYKQYGSGNIPTVKSYIKYSHGNYWNAKKFSFEDRNIQQEDKIKINKMVDALSKYSATDLVTITHNQNPWRDAYKPFLNNKISNESLWEYFHE